MAYINWIYHNIPCISLQIADNDRLVYETWTLSRPTIITIQSDVCLSTDNLRKFAIYSNAFVGLKQSPIHVFTTVIYNAICHYFYPGALAMFLTSIFILVSSLSIANLPPRVCYSRSTSITVNDFCVYWLHCLFYKYGRMVLIGNNSHSFKGT